jgi:hypothetical protein
MKKTWNNLQLNGKITLTLALFFSSLGLSPMYAQSTIEGEWKDPKNGGVILIYEEDENILGNSCLWMILIKMKKSSPMKK